MKCKILNVFRIFVSIWLVKKLGLLLKLSIASKLEFSLVSFIYILEFENPKSKGMEPKIRYFPEFFFFCNHLQEETFMKFL